MNQRACGGCRPLSTSGHAYHLMPWACMQVPYWQSKIVQGCRKRGKPVIVATNMLESMIDNPHTHPC